MGDVVEHGGGYVSCVTEKILTDYDNGKTRGGDVFLRSGIKHTEFGNVDGLGQNAGRNVGNERHVAGFGQLVEFGAVYGVVHADVEIIGVLGEGRGVELRNVGIGFVGRRRDGLCLAVAGSLLKGLVGPLTGNNIIGLARTVHKVQRNGGKLGGGAALQKQDLIIVGNVHDLAKQGLGTLDYGLIYFGAVGHFHDRLAASVIIKHLIGGGF